MPEGISDLVVTGYLEKPLRCPNDFTPFVHKISRFYVSYSRGWWGSESVYFFHNAKFPSSSQLRQLTKATLMYAQDHDEVLPCFWDYYDGEGKFGGWIFYSVFGECLQGNFNLTKGSIYAYVHNPQIYTCPSDRCRQGNSYSYNGALSPNPFVKIGLGFQFGLPLAVIQEPSVVMFTEEETYYGSTNDGHQLPNGD